MNPEVSKLRPECSSFLKDVTEYALCTASRKNLQVLLTDPQAWTTFVAKADYSREEAAALCERLSKLNDEDTHQNEQECREGFLHAFPLVKGELEEHITQLHQQADEANKVHKKFTMLNMGLNFFSILGSILTIISVFLQVHSEKISDNLSAVGLVLVSISAMARVCSDHQEKKILESLKFKENCQALGQNNLDKTRMEILREIGSKFCSVIKSIINCVQSFRKNPYNRLHKDISSMIIIMTVNRISGKSTGILRILLGAKPVAHTAVSLFISVITPLGLLIQDVITCCEDIKHLREGAELESAETLRQQARDLQRMLEMLGQIHGSLWQDPFP